MADQTGDEMMRDMAELSKEQIAEKYPDILWHTYKETVYAFSKDNSLEGGLLKRIAEHELRAKAQHDHILELEETIRNEVDRSGRLRALAGFAGHRRSCDQEGDSCQCGQDEARLACLEAGDLEMPPSRLDESRRYQLRDLIE